MSEPRWVSVTSGVPQGSVLGPILFVLFVNYLNDVVTSASPLYKFADDQTIVRPILSRLDHIALQRDVHNIFGWTLRNKLPLNLSECSVMHMTRSRSPCYFEDYFMGKNKLDEVNDFKLLGFTFGKDQVTFDFHIT